MPANQAFGSLQTLAHPQFSLLAPQLLAVFLWPIYCGIIQLGWDVSWGSAGTVAFLPHRKSSSIVPAAGCVLSAGRETFPPGWTCLLRDESA